MGKMPRPEPPKVLAQRLQDHSDELNASRLLTEPKPASRIPVLGPLLSFLRRLANRLATRWYVTPLVEQQQRFNTKVTAAYDTLAAAAVAQAQWIEALARSRGNVPPSPETNEMGSQSVSEKMASYTRLSPEALRAWEDTDLPADLDTHHENAVANIHDPELSIRHPLSWKQLDFGWRYLFNMAVVGPVLNCQPGDLVLDFAGGSGWVSEFLNRFGQHTVLMDYAEVVLRHSRARLAADSRLGEVNLLPVCGDGMHLPFPDNTFDGIICMNAFHHMPSYEATLREMCRVLRPGCRAVFGEPGEIHASVPISQWTMQQQGVYEKNIHLPLIYVYAMRSGFSHMWRYPYSYPERVEFAYPEVSRRIDTVLEHMRGILEEDLTLMSLFALQKAGERRVDTNAPTWQLDRYHVHGQVTVLKSVTEVRAGSTVTDRVLVKNTGEITWLATPNPFGGYVSLGLKLCDPKGHEISDTLERPALPHDLAPGEEVELEVPIQAPDTPGTYLIKYDLVNEWRTWFEMYGSKPTERPLIVIP